MLKMNKNATQNKMLKINLKQKLKNNMPLITESKVLKMNQIQPVIENEKLKIESKILKNSDFIIHLIQLMKQLKEIKKNCFII